MLKWPVEGTAPGGRRQESDSLEGESAVGAANLFSLTSTVCITNFLNLPPTALNSPGSPCSAAGSPLAV